MNMKCVKLFTAVVVLATGMVMGGESGDPRTFYVAEKGGDDGNDGQSRETPFATFAKGVRSLCRTNDRLVVLKGHHLVDETVPQYMRDSVLPGGVSIVGDSDDPADVVVDGQGKYRLLAWSTSNNNASGGMTVANITFKDAGNGVDFVSGGTGGTPFRIAISRAVVSNCVFSGFNVLTQSKSDNSAWTPLYLGGANNTISDCKFLSCTNADPSSVGVYMSEGAGHAFDRCLFSNNFCRASANGAVGGVVHLRFAAKQHGIFTDCVFVDNFSTNTCACVYLIPGYPGGVPSSFKRCKFLRNVSRYGVPTVFAGQSSGYCNADVRFDDCDFIGNVAVDGATSSLGGGIVAVPSTNGYHNCIFSNNWNRSTAQVASAGIGIIPWGDGPYLAAIHRTNVIENCLFVDNHTMATGGGALGVWLGGVKMTDCIFEKNAAHKKAEGGGGAMCAMSYNQTTPSQFVLIDRCQFRGNFCYSRGGAINAYSTSLGKEHSSYIRNCIFEGNACSNGTEHAGSAIACVFFEDLAIENCTFITNYCYGSGTVYGRNLGSASSAEAKWCVSNCLFYGNVTRANTHKSIRLDTWYADADMSERKRAAAKCGNNYLQTAIDKTFFPDGERKNIFANDDPFTDFGGGDLTVAKASPARDAAAIRPWMTAEALDIYGKKRVSGRAKATALPDIGAAEFQYRLGLLLILK